MQYRNLGRTGIKVSHYALGAMMLGASGAIGNTDRDEGIRIIHKALDAGINLIDTADAYSAGGSEEIVGAALKDRRDDVVLATKFGLPMGQDPNRRGGSRRWITTAVEDSLRRLGTDRIDLFQLQRPDPDTDVEETLSALTDLVRSGKVRAIGSSTMPASDIVEARWTAERRGLQAFHTEQAPYSILNRGIESEVLPTARRHGMGVLVWSPLAKGMLTGRIRKGRDTDLQRTAVISSISDERRIDAVERLVPIAEEAGLPLTHLALGFASAHPDVTSTILGPRTMEHLDGLLSGVDVVLSEEVLDRIDAVVRPGSDVGEPDQSAYLPPAIRRPELRRRPIAVLAA